MGQSSFTLLLAPTKALRNSGRLNRRTVASDLIGSLVQCSWKFSQATAPSLSMDTPGNGSVGVYITPIENFFKPFTVSRTSHKRQFARAADQAIATRTAFLCGDSRLPVANGDHRRSHRFARDPSAGKGACPSLPRHRRGTLRSDRHKAIAPPPSPLRYRLSGSRVHARVRGPC